jgi:multidrug efflux system membrane fusion protein
MSPAYSPETTEPEQYALSVPSTKKSSPEPDAAGGNGFLRKILVLLVILGAVGFSVWKIDKNATEQKSSGKKQAASGERAIPVTVSPVESKTMPIYLTALGTVTAYNTVTIKTRVDGQLISMNVREGQPVRKGQLLAQIDPAPYQAAVAQAEGQLVKDQAAAVNAKTEADRYTALFNAGVVSQASEQTQVSNAGQSAGAIQADKATIQAAKVNLAYTWIAAPIDGVVGLRQVDPGNIVHVADMAGLILVTQLQPISVIFTLPEEQLPQVQQTIRKGTNLAVEVYDRSDTTQLASGRLLTLDNQIDTATGTVKAKAIFDNKDHVLFPNQFVNVRLILQQKQDSLVIPSAAMQSGTQGNFVYVVKQGNLPKGDEAGSKSGSGKSKHKDKFEAPSEDDSGAEKAQKDYVEVRPIVVDLTQGSQVIVSSGLAPGEQVVIDGQEKLKNGSKVSPKQSTSRSGRKFSKGSGPQGDAPQATQPSAESKDGSASSKGHKKEQRP